jgi:hypothetical protein
LIPRSANASRISTAALQARSASSSCSTGTRGQRFPTQRDTASSSRRPTNREKESGGGSTPPLLPPRTESMVSRRAHRRPSGRRFVWTSFRCG